VEVRFFGEFEALEAGVPVPVRGTKQRRLLALLALHRGRPVSADRLIDVLWGDAQVANPVNALQAQIGQLRRTFGATAGKPEIISPFAGPGYDIAPGVLFSEAYEGHLLGSKTLPEEVTYLEGLLRQGAAYVAQNDGWSDETWASSLPSPA
jgi:DNA-binding winged helix-turn-helix (wHTH) protein